MPKETNGQIEEDDAKLKYVKGDFYVLKVSSYQQLMGYLKDPVMLKQIEQQVNSRGLLILEE